jgi:glutaredoxin
MVQKLTQRERSVLAEIFHSAASKLRYKFKNVSFSSLVCERGLMLRPKHQPLLRLQIRNYLHTDMRLYGGAEELVATLLEVDPGNVENQLLRGKIAFEQGEYDNAVVWLKKAARVGRRQRGKIVEEAWHLLDLAKGKQEEIKASLSMTRELEAMLARAKQVTAKAAAATARTTEEGTAEPAGGRVTLYMTRWCRYCNKARSLLRGMKIQFEEKDIEKDRDALVEMMRYADEAGIEVTGVPVLRIGNNILVGYNPQRIESLVQQIR